MAVLPEKPGIHTWLQILLDENERLRRWLDEKPRTNAVIVSAATFILGLVIVLKFFAHFLP